MLGTWALRGGPGSLDRIPVAELASCRPTIALSVWRAIALRQSIGHGQSPLASPMRTPLPRRMGMAALPRPPRLGQEGLMVTVQTSA